MNNTDFKIKVNDLSTKKYISNIKKYLKSNVLNNDKFICCHYRECKKSRPNNFFEGQSYHIGNSYDLKINNKPFRIMVVGQELGHRRRKLTLKDRCLEMACPEEETWIFKKRNQHFRGTTSILRLLLGKNLGEDYESEFINLPNGEERHIFDAFAFTNYLLCSALRNEQGMTGASSSKMKKNCCEHFINSVKILKPNAIIVQGFGIGGWIKDSFDDIKPISGSEIIYQAEVNNFSTIVAFFSHPSSRDVKLNWGNNDHTEYLLKTVKPNVKKIHKIIGII